MGHFAQVDENNIVVNVVVADDKNPTKSKEFLEKNLGGTWIQTSYNTQGGEHLLGGTPLRKNYAGIGFSYDSQLDAFIPPKLFESWVLDEETCLWKAPIPKPEGEFSWDESIVNWVEAQGE